MFIQATAQPSSEKASRPDVVVRLYRALDAWIRRSRKRTANRRVLQRLPDHLLDDIGVVRTDIDQPSDYLHRPRF